MKKSAEPQGTLTLAGIAAAAGHHDQLRHLHGADNPPSALQLSAGDAERRRTHRRTWCTIAGMSCVRSSTRRRIPRWKVCVFALPLLVGGAIACGGQPSLEGWICLNSSTCMLDPNLGDPGHYATNGEYDPCHCFDNPPIGLAYLCPLNHGALDNCPARLDAGEVAAGGRAP